MSAVTSLEFPTFSASPLPVEEPLYEVVNGKRVALPRMSILANRVAGRLHTSMDSFALSHGLGTVVMEDIFILDPQHKLQRRPDVAFVSTATWPADRELPE